MEKLAQHIKSHLAISDKTLGLITDRFSEKKYRKKEHLLHFNSISRHVYFVSKGCLRTYITDFNGVEHNIHFSVENWWAGDLASFVEKTPAKYRIQALEDTTVHAINLNDWEYLVREVPEFLKYSRILFRNDVIAQQNRTVQNLSYTAMERYEHFIQNHADLAQRIAQKHIASYLGLTPEFLSLLKKQYTS
ncbi:cyclic nucleotide-binding domain-containing protein [Leptobacterium flavescens]|uniref:Cyclic nucleotide-binding domain-containing protein n=1 Tax=Leptobacterium flavescens TaxID=472055 RepID=A0A6P0UKM7_9FLAO|nr:Crp/Fnr family transcriptional regulator [Leptobacterium flavescens]NER13517.1 cyclic nucleotide-binding domain-containing protein [Leptobacterium flavescens]